MSPEEFAAHPAAVFHSTYLPDTDLFDLSKRNPSSAGGSFSSNGQPLPVVKKMHLGTLQAALENMMQSAGRPEQYGTIHTFWQVPRVSADTRNLKLSDMYKLDQPVGESPAEAEYHRNNPENVAHYAPGSQYYHNQNEDEGRPSFATDKPLHTLASQEEYVQAALVSGVPESHIHPRTLAQYKAGTLGKMRLNANIAQQMSKHADKLGPLKKAGPNWRDLIESEGPKKPDDMYEY